MLHVCTFYHFLDTSSQDKLTPPWPWRLCKLLTVPAMSFIGLLFIWKHDSRLAETCTCSFHKLQFVLYVRVAHIHIEHLSVVLFPHPPTHPRHLSSFAVLSDRWAGPQPLGGTKRRREQSPNPDTVRLLKTAPMANENRTQSTQMAALTAAAIVMWNVSREAQ